MFEQYEIFKTVTEQESMQNRDTIDGCECSTVKFSSERIPYLYLDEKSGSKTSCLSMGGEVAPKGVIHVLFRIFCA